MHANQGFGFTLLEVLVALAVLAVAMGALLKVAADSSQNIDTLRSKTLASWVAANKINELLLERGWPELGTRQGVSAMAGQQWRWQLVVSNTAEPALRRIDVSVRIANAEAALIQLAAFKGKP